MKYRWLYLQESEPNNYLQNMAFDEWMLHQVLQPPMIRLYRWSKPTYSIGYFQSVSKTVESYECFNTKDQVVRRITGGGLVKHDKEWTLSVAMDTSLKLLPTTVSDSYVHLHQLLIQAFTAIGVQARLMKAPCQMNARGRRACFEEPVNHDVEVNGRKVIGTSQRRVAGRVLFQTSIQWDQNPHLPKSILSVFEKWLGQGGEALVLTPDIKREVQKLIDQKYTKPDYSFSATSINPSNR